MWYVNLCASPIPIPPKTGFILTMWYVNVDEELPLVTIGDVLY